MRIAFDSRPSAEADGVGRYSRCLLSALASTAGAGAELIETHAPKRADVYHSPWMQGAILRSPCPMVVTLHDLSALKRRSEHLRRASLPSLRHLAVQRASRVIVPTSAVARDAVSRLDLDEERIAVIPEAPDPIFHPRQELEIAQVRERLQLPERYLLWVVGCMQRPTPRRQLARLAAAPREMPLVLVGQVGPWAHELSGVIVTGRVADADLAAIYSGAHALVLPSEEEGFGRTAIEALACGAPVAAFDRPALREVLASRAAYVEPGDLHGLVQAAERAIRPAPSLRRWAWEDAGRATWKVYEQAAARDSEACLSLRRLRRSRASTVAR